MDESTCAKLLAERDSSEWHLIPVFLTGTVRFEGRYLTLEVKRRGKRSRGGWVYIWYLLDDVQLPISKMVVAAGTARKLIDHGDVLELCASTVTPSYRGNGLYRSILLELSRVFGYTIESDIAISTAARKSWERVGGVEALRESCKVMRLDPK